jgi:uncharacterized protein YceK
VKPGATQRDMITECAKRAVAGALLVAVLSGCTTIGTLSEQDTNNKIFSGTIRQVELKCAHAVCLDFPFSLAADAVLLPVTVPWSVVNFIQSDDKEPQHPGGKENGVRNRFP